MNPTSPSTDPAVAPLPAPFDVLATLPLVETDGVPLETPWHRMAINLLIEAIVYFFRDRNDFFVGGNMFIYYSVQQVRNRDFCGPDFFFVQDVERNRERMWWAIWDEGGRFPDVIIELLSPSTAELDRTTKRTPYERTFRTPEYFLYDPDTNQLEGWRLNARQRYQAIQPDQHGRLRSEVLGLWLGAWTGLFQETDATWPRFFDAEGQLVPTRAEAAEQRAAAEAQRAAAEAERAATAEAEVERLRKEVEALRQRSPGGPSDG